MKETLKMTTKSSRKSGFTLIELLVVITIIGLLAGLAVPAISGALDRAKQTADVVNARQLGIILFTIANDENGFYPSGGLDSSGNRVDAANARAFFDSLIVSRELTEPKLVWSSSAKPKENLNKDTPALAAENLAFEYTKDLKTTNDASIPLIASKGAFASKAAFKGEVELTATNVWEKKGAVVYTLGNSANWIKSKADKISAGVDDSVDLTNFTLLKAE